jgi:hypothetical protein
VKDDFFPAFASFTPLGLPAIEGGAAMANATNGSFVWHEHLTKDPKAAIAFYGEVIGWKTQPFGDDDARALAEFGI